MLKIDEVDCFSTDKNGDNNMRSVDLVHLSDASYLHKLHYAFLYMIVDSSSDSPVDRVLGIC